jgi:Tripartite tricarboxylate transporter TctB family
VSRDGIAWPTVATAAVLAGGAAYLLSISPAIPGQARLYPQIFLLATLAGSILLALQTLARGWRARADGARQAVGSDEAAGAGLEAPAAEDLDRPGWPLYPALVVYVLVLDRLGFVVATILFLAGALLWLRMSALKAVALAVAGALVIFVVFRTVMYVSLPAGPVDIYLLELIYGA